VLPPDAERGAGIRARGCPKSGIGERVGRRLEEEVREVVAVRVEMADGSLAFGAADLLTADADLA
jgi:hypothetical protein